MSRFIFIYGIPHLEFAHIYTHTLFILIYLIVSHHPVNYFSELQYDQKLQIYLTAGKLLRGFDPAYPTTLWIDTKTFCNGLPFHIVFDEEVRQVPGK